MSRARSKGTGSITKRGKSYRIRYDGPRDANGHRKQITETVSGDKKEAEKVLWQRLNAMENGTYVSKHKETVREFMQRWLDTYAATNTSPRTQQGYGGNIVRYIIPAIGNVELQKLTPAQVQKMYADLLKPERQLSARTVLHVHRVLRTALQSAFKWGLVTRNVADVTDPPRAEHHQSGMWDIPTINCFLDTIKDHRFRYFYTLALYTGMRRSELSGLRWDNVAPDKSYLSVVSTRQRVNGGWVEGQPKTPRSRRLVSLTKVGQSLLREIEGWQLGRREDLGETWVHSGYVLVQDDGRPMNPDKLTQEFARLVKVSGLPHLTLHGLRHAHASLLIADGKSPKLISERLGHSNIAITMDTYGHVMPGLQAEAISGFDELLKPADSQ